jgi:hypothetical protein
VQGLQVECLPLRSELLANDKGIPYQGGGAKFYVRKPQHSSGPGETAPPHPVQHLGARVQNAGHPPSPPFPSPLPHFQISCRRDQLSN